MLTAISIFFRIFLFSLLIFVYYVMYRMRTNCMSLNVAYAFQGLLDCITIIPLRPHRCINANSGCVEKTILLYTRPCVFLAFFWKWNWNWNWQDKYYSLAIIHWSTRFLEVSVLHTFWIYDFPNVSKHSIYCELCIWEIIFFYNLHSFVCNFYQRLMLRYYIILKTEFVNTSTIIILLFWCLYVGLFLWLIQTVFILL